MSESGRRVRQVRYKRTLEVSFEGYEEEAELEPGPGPDPQHARRSIALGLEDRSDLHAYASGSFAEEICRGVLDGTWVITDHFEHDMRRFLIAERCREGDGRALTERERQVLELALRGHSNKYIGLDLGLTASTVATHLRRTMSKLGVESREALIQALIQAP